MNAGATPETRQFELLAMPLLGRLYNFGRWLSRDEAEAEDLVQETYARALKGFASFQPGTNFAAWMFRILRNVFFTARSRESRRQYVSIHEEGEEAVLPLTHETPESLLISARTQQQIQAALERLPEMYREVVLLCDVEEMSYREIAELVQVPIGTVMSRIARGRRALRGLLAEQQMRVGR